MAVSSVSNYGTVYGNAYASQKKETNASNQGRLSEAAAGVGTKGQTGAEESTKTQSTQEYLKSLQKKAPSMELVQGSQLSMNRDKKATLAISPELLKKMQEDPEAEKKYTQLVQDIERAEKTATAYYNALGGVVERTSHWYIDENGKYYHFAYTRRDDKLNKKIREEAKKNTEELIEKTREKSRKKAEELEEQLAEKAEEAKEEEAKEEKKEQDSAIHTKTSENTVDPAMEATVKLLTEKLEASENGEVYLNEKDMQPVMEAIRAEENAPARSTGRAGRAEAGTAVDLKV